MSLDLLDPQLGYLIALAVAAVPLVTVVVRSSILLIGLLFTLSKASPGDRPEIFREFTRAISNC